MKELKNYDNNIEIYLSEISRYKVLSSEEEKELFIRYKNGDMNAKELLIKHNLRLTVSCVKGIHALGLDYLDLVQEGNIGLIKAIEDFDLSYNVRFSTYAYPKIKSRISKAIYLKNKLIKLPYALYKKYVKLNNEKEKLEKNLNRKVTNEELSFSCNIPLNEIEYIFSLPMASCSLDEYVIKEEESFSRKLTFFEIKDNKDNFINNMEEDNLNNILYNLINDLPLPARDKQIVLYRYGFIDDKVHTRREISEKLNVSKQNIEQIEKKVLKCIASNKEIIDLLKIKNKKYYDELDKDNIYESFKPYSKEEIDDALNCLTQYRKKIVKIWYDNKDILTENKLKHFIKLVLK